MAIEITVEKHNQSLIPVDGIGLEEIELLKNGEYRAVLSQPRNYKFHRKFFALIKVAYEAWEPEPVYHKNVLIEKNLKRFRKDLIIQAGYYDTVFNINGELRLEEKSISFASMSEEDFERLYSRVIDVVLGKVLTHYTRDDLDDQCERVLSFA